MRAVVVYESMYGNTHLIADAIASGLGHSLEVAVVSVHDVKPALADGVDLLVVGGPTHVHGMTRPNTRLAAIDSATKPDSALTVDPDAEGPGVREWLDSAGPRNALVDTRAAAFDTRVDAPAAFTGRASKGIAHKLRGLGCSLIVEPESFLVTKEAHLEPDEEAHARRWGATLGATLLLNSNQRALATGTPVPPAI